MGNTRHSRVLIAAASVVSASLVANTRSASPLPRIAPVGAAPETRAPLTARRVAWRDGQLIGLSPWRALAAGQGDTPSAYAFDAYESASGLPGASPSGSPLLFQANSLALVHSDMSLAPGFAGKHARLADIVFMAGDPTNPGMNADFYYTLFTVEDNLEIPCQLPATVYEGVQLHFGPGDGFFVANVDLTSSPDLSWKLPIDGHGAYLVLLSQDPGGSLAAFGQPAWWCTGEDEIPPETRAGTNNPAQGIDDASLPGCIVGGNLVLEYPCECKDFSQFGLPTCSNLTASVGFGVVDAMPCPADCDADGTLSIDDFICFQSLFALGGPGADCDGDGTFAIDDFICFQTFFAVGCG